MALTRKKTELPPGVVDALARKGRGVDASALLEAITDAWGGAKNLALDIKDAYDSANPGSPTRIRTLEMIQRLVINNTNQQLTHTRTPSEMTDDELTTVATQTFKKLGLLRDDDGVAQEG